MIEPTIGRIVWFHEPGDHVRAAIVTFVHDSRCVNLAVFDHGGDSYPMTSVTLIQDDDVPLNASHCEWMPYQKGQAAKLEEVRTDLVTMAELDTLVQRVAALEPAG